MFAESGKKLKKPNNNFSILTSYTFHVEQNCFDAYTAIHDSENQSSLGMDARKA